MTQRLRKGMFKLMPVPAVMLLVFALSFGFFASQNSNVSAAVDTYVVTGGDVASFPLVGAASVTLNTITITEDGAADDFLADPETIVVAIDADYQTGVVFDQTVTTVTVAGTCGYDGHNAVTYTDAYTIQIPITGAGSPETCGIGETITLAGLKVKTIHAQAAPVANPLINVDNATTSLGAPIDSTSLITLAVTQADAAASLALGANATVGTAGNTTLTVTVPVDMANTDTIAFDAPAHLDVSGVAFGSETFAGAGTFATCAAAVQTITCTANGVITAGTGTIVMTGITSLYAATGATITNVEVTDVAVSGELTASDASGTVTNAVAADAGATVTLGTNATVGGAGNTTLTLTVPFALDADDEIVVTFPAQIDISAVGAAVTGTFESSDSITCSAAGQVLTCVTSAATNATGTIIMTGIVSATAGTTDITSLLVVDEGVAGNNIASDTTVALTDSVAGGLTLTNVQPDSLVVSATGTTTVTFTTANSIPVTGKIKVTFGAGFDVSAASGATCSTMDGSFATSVAGQVVTITRSAGTIQTAAAESCTIANITNPAVVGSTGVYAIATTTSADAVIDQDLAVTADTMTGGAGGGTTIPPTTSTPTCSILINGGAAATTTQNVTINITSANATSIILSENSSFSGAAYQQIGTSISYTLSAGEGSKTVYAKCKNSAGTETAITSDSITYSVTATPTQTTPTTPTIITQDPTPAPALSAGVQAYARVGDLVKISTNSAVYFIDNDNRRHAFPTENDYFSWFSSFANVKTIPLSILSQIPLGSNITMRPGSFLIKIESEPTVYAVSPYGVIHAIPNASVAVALYGSNWEARLKDVSVAFWPNYQVGQSLSATMHPTGAVIRYAGTADVYYIDNGTKHLVSASVFSSNLYQARFVSDISSSITYPTGAAQSAISIEQLMTLR